MNLTNFKMATLVSMINSLGGVASAKTFSQRSKAIARLMKIAADRNIDLATTFDADGNKIVASKKISIRSVAESLLTQVGDDGFGLSYDKVLAAVKAQFPTAKTTAGCLRWYAAHMEVALPKRARASKAA